MPCRGIGSLDLRYALAPLQGPVLSGLRCFRNSEQEAARPCANQTVSYGCKPSSLGPGCPGPPSTARSPRARSRLSSKSAPTEPAGMNPTSTAGLPIPPRGVRKVSSMKSGKVGGCLPSARPVRRHVLLQLTAVNRTGLRPSRLARLRLRFAASALTA
jgi:hypothetical protein